MMWKVYLPTCTHHQSPSNYCDNCIGVTLNNLMSDIIKQVSTFDASVVIEGDDESLEHQLINKYAEGTVQGYKDAVQQILEFLKDLRASNNA